jgi:hypothetical protein
MKKLKIGLGVTGGIAAYKAIEVMRLLQKSGCEVSVAMTRHATEFVQPLTFRALNDRHVIVDDYDPENPDPIAHINFSQEIDLLDDRWKQEDAAPLWSLFTNGLRADKIKAQIAYMKKKHNVDLFVLDHFGYIDIDVPHGTSELKLDELKARYIKDEICKALGVTVVVIAHTTTLANSPMTRVAGVA